MMRKSEGTQDDRSTQRVELQQRWLADTVIQVRRQSFYGELTVSLKFEDGQCVYGEHTIRERIK